MRRKLQGSLDEMGEALSTPVTRVAPPKDLKPGETVELIHLGTKGTVITPPNDKGEATVQAGIMKMKVHVSQLRRMEETSKEKKKTGNKIQISARPASMEVDVRGMNLEEAIGEVDMFIDNAVLAGLKTVSIIHGKGAGILRSGIQQHLKRYPAVQEFRLGRFGEGEDGVTIVTLK